MTCCVVVVDAMAACKRDVCIKLRTPCSIISRHIHRPRRTFRTKVGADCPSIALAVLTASHARSMACSVEKAMEEPAPPVASPCNWMLSKMRRVRSPNAGDAGVVVVAVAAMVVADGASRVEGEADSPAGAAVARSCARCGSAIAGARCGTTKAVTAVKEQHASSSSSRRGLPILDRSLTVVADR